MTSGMKIKEVRHLLTYECNLRCRHCYLSAGEHQQIAPKAFAQEECDRFYLHFRPEIVSATGGEPLLKRGLVFKIAKSTALYGGAMELVTNGFFLTKCLVGELQRINPKTFYQISLDGGEEFHNSLRQNPEAYTKALRAIDIASASGAVTKVRLTATNKNFGELPEVVKVLDAFSRFNIRLVIRPVVPKGRALRNKLKTTFNFAALDELKNLAKNITVGTTDTMGRCGCGVDTIAVDPKGDIYPCTYFVFNPENKMGNIVSDFESLSEKNEFKNFKGVCYARRSKEELSI